MPPRAHIDQIGFADIPVTIAGAAALPLNYTVDSLLAHAVLLVSSQVFPKCEAILASNQF